MEYNKQQSNLRALSKCSKLDGKAKLISLFIVLVLNCLFHPLFAQRLASTQVSSNSTNNSTGLAYASQYEAEHAIEVRRLSNWAPDYLTVINNWDNMTYTPYVSNLKCMSVITSINGQDTRELEEEDFYRILDSSEEFTLVYLTKSLGENKEHTNTFKKKKGKLLATPCYPSTSSPTVSLLSDNDVDFFQFNTFDYRLIGDDQLMDKTIMEVFANHLKQKGLKRVTSNPDLFLYLTKDVNQKIESVYVPSYTTTTTTGDTGVEISNFLGMKGVSVGGSSGQATTVTKETGSMRTNVTADAYLEFSILDASKLNSSNAPIIWQLTYSEHKTSEIRLLEYVKQYLGGYMIQYPFHENTYSEYLATWGVFCENFSTDPTLSDIVPGSTAESLGCKHGDVIKYVRYNDTDGDFCTFRPGQNFYLGKIITTTNMIQIGKNKITKGGITELKRYLFIL